MRGSYSEEEARPAVVRQNLANKRLVPCDLQTKRRRGGAAVSAASPPRNQIFFARWIGVSRGLQIANAVNSASGQSRARRDGVAGIYGNVGIVESVTYRI